MIEMEIGDVVCNSKGVKSAQITNKKGAPLFERLTGIDEPISTPFGASTFNDSAATRKNICFRCTPKLAKRLAAIGAYLQSYIDKHSGRLFKGKKLTYKPLLIPQKDDYEPLMRCKINTEGRGACRCWNDQHERVDMPDDCETACCVREYRLSPFGSWVIAAASRAASWICWFYRRGRVSVFRRGLKHYLMLNAQATQRSHF